MELCDIITQMCNKLYNSYAIYYNSKPMVVEWVYHKMQKCICNFKQQTRIKCWQEQGLNYSYTKTNQVETFNIRPRTSDKVSHTTSFNSWWKFALEL